MTSEDKTTAANGWPDSARPGVPENPERDGWHWVGRSIWAWDADEQAWEIGNGQLGLAGEFAGSFYHGPCLTPAEVAAREAAAKAEGMREAAEIAASKRSNAALTTVSYKAGYRTGVFEAAAAILAAIEPKEPTT